MIRHILLIEFKAETSDHQLAFMRQAFLNIPAQVEGVEALEWGANNSPEGLNKTYSHCVQMTFTDESARESYLPHPAHKALLDIFLPLLEDIVVFDYEISLKQTREK